MKRTWILAGGLLLAFFVAGCGGGIEEGPPKEGSLDPATPDLKAFMKQNAGNMQPKPSQKKKAAAPTPEATKETKDSP